MIVFGLLAAAFLLALALSFFFSGSETAVVSVNRYRLRSLQDEGDANAGRLLDMLGDTQRLLVMTLIGTNLANVLAALLFKELLERGWPGLEMRTVFDGISATEVLGLVILTPIVVLFAEIVPKALFRARADHWLGPLRQVYVALVFVFRPLIVVVEWIARLFLSPWRDPQERALRNLTRRDIVNLITPGRVVEGPGAAEEAFSESDPYDQPLGDAITREVDGEEERLAEETNERELIHNIIELQETSAGDIMTPLVDLAAVRHDALHLDGLKHLARQTGFSRFPVYRDRVVNITGFIDIFRVLREENGTHELDHLVEEPFYVPETTRVDDLLQDFLRQRVKVAVVVDEYGGCSGWITREDILEEIVGELEDELDRPGAQIKETGDGEFVAEGRTEIEPLNLALDADFGDDEWETLAGLLLFHFRRVPRAGDTIEVDGWHMQVERMDGNRIDLVRIRRAGRNGV